MGLLDIFKKKPTNTGLFTDADFDNLFNVVFIKGIDDKFAEVYLKTDKGYEPTSKSIKKSDIIILPFSKGVQEFCINRNMPIIMNSKVEVSLLKYFISYLKGKGVPDVLVDSFEMCWYPGRDLPINKPIYDETGKKTGYKRI